MASFRDQTLLDLADPARLISVLTGTPGHTAEAQGRLLAMISRSYELPFARIDSVMGVSVIELRLQEALFPVSRVRGSISQVMPSQIRSDLTWCETGSLAPIWIDLLADLRITLVAEVDPAGIDSVLLESEDTFTTLDDFRSRFEFLDLDAFMAEHHLQTVDDLREAFQYLRAEIHLRVPPAFDPGDPANQYTVRLIAAVRVADPPDLTALLQWARLVDNAAADRRRPPSAVFGEVVRPYVPMAVLSAAGVTGAGLDTAQLRQFLVTAGIASVLYPPV